jgi:hypothetical protein
MELSCKSIVKRLIRGDTIQIPSVFIEENDLGESSTIDVLYGKNYSCVVLVPTGVKLGSITKERINKLTTEPLTTER